MKGLALFVPPSHIVLATAMWDALLKRNTRLSQNSCCLLDVCCIRRLQSLNAFTFQKAKTLSISFAKVPTLQRIGVDRHLLWVSVAL